ncbi:ketopantoate reductase family protein [Salinibius halmophilus]|uniref:ketopantoate reductase family protein n=1 Tax=Salinibius halmophilus TaxID=1853216 RepID=UPI002279788C|nr:2-dehydropantoate 2-reductase [Salinibius halmophilus]
MISGRSDKNQPVIHIIGAGALGANVYQQLKNLVQPVLVGRHAGRRLIEGQAIEVLSWQQVEQIDTAIICCKVYQLADIIAPLAERLSAKSQVISLCNGMGYDQLLNQLPGTFLPGVTTAAAWREDDQVHLISPGTTTIGGAAQAPLWLSKTSWQWQPDMQAQRWTKLVVNAVINPMTVLYNVRNGALLQPPWYEQACTLSQELNTLVAQLSLDIPDVSATVKAVCEATADNFSSSNQDANAGRPTELPWISGYILQQAAAQQVAMPTYTKVCEQLKEEGYASQLV